MELQIQHGISNLNLTMSVNNKQILSRTVSTGNNTIQFTDTELDNLYKEYSSISNTLTAIFILSGSGYTNSANVIITLKGNQKTGWIKVNGVWRRNKRWIKVNGVWRRCVRWIKVNGIWKRCI